MMKEQIFRTIPAFLKTKFSLSGIVKAITIFIQSSPPRKLQKKFGIQSRLNFYPANTKEAIQKFQKIYLCRGLVNNSQCKSITLPKLVSIYLKMRMKFSINAAK